MFSSIKDVRPYYCVRDYLRKFYGILVDMIFYYILKTESIAFFIENVKQVDLIGNFGYNTSVQLLKPQNVLKILKRKALVNSVKMKLKTFQNNVLKKKTLNSQECSKKIEVIIGVGLYSSDEIIAMHNIMDVNIMQPGSDVIVNYQRVIMNFTPPPWEKLTQILFANRAHSLRLIYVGRDDPSTFDVICEGLPHLSDLSVIGSPIPYLKCFNKLSHLQHLSLVGKGLRIQLKHLSSLPSGLTYLKLVDCELYDDDLDFIALSHHAGTLRQLGISNSRFSEPSVSSGNPDGGLIGLCQHLTSLTVLQINWSDLHLWSANGLQKLMNAIKDLPQLVLLDLLRLNIFTEDQLLMQISCLGASSSLKVIHLEYPRNVVESGMNAFKLKFYNALQSTRSEKDLHINLGFHKLSLLTYLTNIPH
ncbi:unnamed protein product [Meganyctiphanes norvegica]|uniref:Uncharacterized protein n=1 Tax=Meganyctiphanes norvegica TaxID=48144 RepID=A0AAV2S690_MEGNR